MALLRPTTLPRAIPSFYWPHGLRYLVLCRPPLMPSQKLSTVALISLTPYDRRPPFPHEDCAQITGYERKWQRDAARKALAISVFGANGATSPMNAGSRNLTLNNLYREGQHNEDQQA